MVEHSVRGWLEQLIGDLAVGQEHDSIRITRSYRIMGDHDDGLTELADRMAHERQNLGSRRAVQVAGWFVGEDDVGLARKSSSDGDPLLLATRELVRPVLQSVG